MEGRGADVRFPADGGDRLAALRPAQNRYDLLRRMSFSFWHLGPFLGAQSLIGDGSVRVRQVMTGTLLTKGSDTPPPSEPSGPFEVFLSDSPLNSPYIIIDAIDEMRHFTWPSDYRDYCPICDGVRRHHCEGRDSFLSYNFASYACVDCEGKSTIEFGLKKLKQMPVIASTAIICKKVFQNPDFGAPIPKNLYELIGEENRVHFLQARRSLARGLGIGSFTYYRRIIENNKLNLINSVLKVAVKVGASEAQIEHLRAAAAEKQFSRAIGMLKAVDAIPAVLLIDGQNPLLLLHDELSEGVHSLTDVNCLERAKHSEIILFELARLMRVAISEKKDVSQALSAIMNRKKGSASA